MILVSSHCLQISARFYRLPIVTAKNNFPCLLPYILYPAYMHSRLNFLNNPNMRRSYSTFNVSVGFSFTTLLNCDPIVSPTVIAINTTAIRNGSAFGS